MSRALPFLKRALVAIVVLIVGSVVVGVITIQITQARQRSATRIETENGIESLEFVQIGGVAQSIYLRGHDRDSPVLLFVHGGPGGPSMPMARDFGFLLEEHFVVVHWDQRGAGNSCSDEIPDDSLNLEQYLADTRELIDLLRNRFEQDKIFLVGHSWGSVLGLITAQRHPERLHAYVGMGQVVDMLRNEEISYRFVVDRATADKNEQALEELASIKPPYASREALMLQRNWLGYYRGDFLEGGGFAKFVRGVVLSPEYDVDKKLSFYSCAMNSLDQAWGDLEDINFIETVRRVEVPVFVFAGRHDYNTPFELVEILYEGLSAPHKELVWFENSAHSPNLEEPGRYQEVLIERLLPISN